MRLQSLALQNTEELHDLDSTVQTLITELAQNPRSFDEVKTLIQAETASVKGQITFELQQHQERLAHEQHRQRFLETLCFPEIHRRQDTVSEAYQKTFQWVYEPDAIGGSAHRWDSIVQWFERGDGIYWISGKAGSGKSTLMKYICQDSRSLDLLKVWSGAKEVLSPTFFFWNAGTSLQKSTEGLVRSVLYQILQRSPALVPLAYNANLALSSAEDGRNINGQTLVWTERRLLKAFQSVVREMQKECRICIFIDGLDEIGGDSDAAIEVIKSMLSADLKVCLSSRPDHTYAGAFDSCATLRLQDLTEPDIRTYIQNRLQPLYQIDSQEDVSIIIDSIVLRAQGVFLWVSLVVKSMIKGLKNHDTVAQLQTRIDSTPSDIEDLYAQMLSNIEAAYREEAAHLFQLTLAGLSNSLLNVALALCNGPSRGSEMTIQEALTFCYRTQRRLPTVCAGLLEVHLEDRDSEEGGGYLNTNQPFVTLPCCFADSSERADISYQERYAHVVFTHRTAMDFLRRSKQGQLFLEENTVLGFSPRSTYVRALLAKVNLLGFPEKHPNSSLNLLGGDNSSGSSHADDLDFRDLVVRSVIFDLMENVVQEDWPTATAQRSLCEAIDRTLATVYKRNPHSSPLLHWSTRWARDNQETDLFTEEIAWSRRTSRSSSLDSFRSTRTEPTLCWNIPFDFLGFAAHWGLYIHVIETLDMQEQHLDEEYASYLLCCSMWPWWPRFSRHNKREGVLATLNLITELLKRGGNPNLYVGHLPTTLWGRFLYGSQSIRFCAPAAFTRTLKAFLESGADINAKIPKPVSIDNVNIYREESLGGPDFFFRHERSPLYIARSWLEEVSELETLPELEEIPDSLFAGMEELTELKSIEDMILAKGGKDFHAFTHVAIGSDGYRPHKLSQRRRHGLIAAATEANHHHPICDKLRSNPMGTFTWWPEQREKIYNGIVDNRPDSESSASSDEDDASVDDAEEGFFECLDTLSVDDMQDQRHSDKASSDCLPQQRRAERDE